MPIDIATALTVANAAPSGSGSAMFSVDWGAMFQPLVNGFMQAISSLFLFFCRYSVQLCWLIYCYMCFV